MKMTVLNKHDEAWIVVYVSESVVLTASSLEWTNEEDFGLDLVTLISKQVIVKQQWTVA